MTKLLSTLSLLFLWSGLLAQNGVNVTTGARGLGMGEASLGFQDIHAAFSNQAGLAYLENFSGLVVAERRFALSELSTYGAAAAFPTNSGTFGIALQYFGFSDYNEQKIGLSYARKLGKKIAVGAQIDYLNTAVTQYGAKGVITMELGIQVQPFKNVWINSHIFSPFRSELVEGEYLPSLLKIGVTYLPSKKVILTAQVDKDIDFDARFRMGVEYKISDPFYLRAGVATNPAQVSFGFGLKLKNGIGLDIASSYHQQLGLSPGIGVHFGG